jgi:hypothetical protein
MVAMVVQVAVLVIPQLVVLETPVHILRLKDMPAVMVAVLEHQVAVVVEQVALVLLEQAMAAMVVLEQTHIIQLLLQVGLLQPILVLAVT